MAGNPCIFLKFSEYTNLLLLMNDLVILAAHCQQWYNYNVVHYGRSPRSSGGTIDCLIRVHCQVHGLRQHLLAFTGDVIVHLMCDVTFILSLRLRQQAATVATAQSRRDSRIPNLC